MLLPVLYGASCKGPRTITSILYNPVRDRWLPKYRCKARRTGPGNRGGALLENRAVMLCFEWEGVHWRAFDEWNEWWWNEESPDGVALLIKERKNRQTLRWCLHCRTPSGEWCVAR
jgi:hypothetical protein